MKSNLLDIYTKIRSYSELKDGWNYGSGIPINEAIITKCIKIIAIHFRDNYYINSFPGEDGSIMLLFYIKEEDKAIELIVNQRGVEFILEQDLIIVLEENIPDCQIDNYLNKYLHGEKENE
ncbi:MAG: hypothetical protein AABY32_04190 [Nanoarchaeota archaeon]